MTLARLDKGTLWVGQDAIMALASKQDMEIDLSIHADGLTASLSVPMGPLHVPVEIKLDRISAAKAIIEGEGLSIHASMFPVPMSLITQFTGKYKFLALDTHHNRIFINLQSLVPVGTSISLGSAKLVENGIEIELEFLEIKELQNI
jgi:hypothetical protein